ncbi:MAG TPA: hypothetical protein VF627_15685 [Abditibacterium sp.]|jgi:hypothetical protein
MPKFQYDEEVLREYSEADEELDLSGFQREESGELSHYEAVQCEIALQKLSEGARSTLEALQKHDIKQILVSYNGGHDEGFAYFAAATDSQGTKDGSEVAENLSNGSLGEDIPPSSHSRYHGEPPERTREEWARLRLERLAIELATQLLGGGYGTGEYSLEGRFVADLVALSLTDVPPQDEQ